LGNDQLDIQPLAGGQSLMPMMNFRLAQPDVLVDLNDLDELRGIDLDGTAVVIGAMTRFSDLERSSEVADHLPLVKLSLPHIAHAAIRNRGTIGGSVALADPAAELPAVLLALDATLIVVCAAGERRIPVDDFFRGLYETALKTGEIIKTVAIPKAQPGDRFAFKELARRHGDYAMAGVAIAARDGDRAPRIAFFGVSDRPVRAVAAENALASSMDENAVELALDAIGALEFHGDLNGTAQTKRHLARVILERALGEL
jgi:carbon-monoxide dehydrogenase medium subunit